MTGITAEKHDSFLSPSRGRHRDRRVQRQGTDPGRARRVELPVRRHARTFEARGYTAWDPTSPPWLLDNGNSVTLVIPTAFVSWTGEALDKKTPLLRSMEAVSRAGRARAEAVRVDGRARVLDLRRRAGILPDRPELLLRAARPDQRRPHALRRQAAQGPGAGGSVLRLDSRARARAAWPTPSSSCSSSACRSRPGTTKSRRASTRSPRSSRTPTSPPITRC